MMRGCFCDFFGGCRNPFKKPKDEPLDPVAISRCLQAVHEYEKKQTVSFQLRFLKYIYFFRCQKQIVLWSPLSARVVPLTTTPSSDQSPLLLIVDLAVHHLHTEVNMVLLNSSLESLLQTHNFNLSKILLKNAGKEVRFLSSHKSRLKFGHFYF